MAQTNGTTGLNGVRVALLVTEYGAEQDELISPRDAITAGGGQPVVVSTGAGPVRTLVGDQDPGEVVDVDLAVADASVDDFAALVLPGGTLNADELRIDDDAVAFVRAFVESGKPIAAICHGPWILVEVGGVDGKTLTSYRSLRTDLLNAGGTWVDQEVTVCTALGRTLITSRTPRDLPAFNSELLAALA